MAGEGGKHSAREQDEEAQGACAQTDLLRAQILRAQPRRSAPPSLLSRCLWHLRPVAVIRVATLQPLLAQQVADGLPRCSR